MSDLDIREAARAEALKRYPPSVHENHDGEPVDVAETWRKPFEDGAQWAVDQLPDRGEIACALRAHNLDELFLGDGSEWCWYTPACSCGWRGPESKYPGDAHEAHSIHAADAVLALIGEKISGGAAQSL